MRLTEDIERGMSEITPVDVTRTYDRYAPIYDSVFGAILGPGRRRMADAVRNLNPRRILEVGVGTGLTLDRYPREAHVTGIDLSADMLRHALQRATNLRDRDICLKVMDAEHLEFEDHSFDCVTVPYVLSVTPNPEKLVAEIRRVCSPGGHILIVNHFSGGRFWWLLERLVRSSAARVGFRSDFEYDRHILNHSWRVLSSSPTNLFGLSRLVVVRNV